MLTDWVRGGGGIRHVQTRQDGMSRIQIKFRRRTATHFLGGISWLHVSDSTGGQEPHGNSQSGREVMGAVSDSTGSREAHGN